MAYGAPEVVILGGFYRTVGRRNGFVISLGFTAVWVNCVTKGTRFGGKLPRRASSCVTLLCYALTLNVKRAIVVA